MLFHYAPGRGKAHPLKFLAGYRGRFLQCDAYQSYDALTDIARDNGPWQLVYCWTHVRRRFVKRSRTRDHPSPRRCCGRSRCSIRSKSPCAARRRPSAWLPGANIRRPSSRRSSPGSRPSCRASRRNPKDIRYTLAHWPGLIRFLDDGTLELDSNPVENQIRPIALTRKNALFAGNEVGAENWAMLASLVATCKMSDANPVDYIAATLSAILEGHPKTRIEELMPWRFQQPSSLAA